MEFKAVSGTCHNNEALSDPLSESPANLIVSPVIRTGLSDWTLIRTLRPHSVLIGWTLIRTLRLVRVAGTSGHSDCLDPKAVQTVGVARATTALMLVACYSGLSNPEEFSFTSDEETQEQTIRRQGHQARDQKRLDTLKKKLHTDDECKSIAHSVPVQ